MSVRSINRTFEILEQVSLYPEGIGVTDIAKAIDLHKSTVSRLLLTLEELNVVQRSPDGVRYRLGNRLHELLTNAQSPKTLIAMAYPYMVELETKLGEDVGLSIRDGDLAHYIAQVCSTQRAIHVKDWTDTRFPLHTTCSGKVMLAYQTQEERERYLALPLAKYTDKTLSNPDQLRRQLAKIRREGIAWAFEEFAEGFAAVSVPIFNRQRNLVAALNLFAPTYRFPNGKQNEIESLMRDTCERISLALYPQQ